jgi:broad specificity phosphatase PhoE
MVAVRATRREWNMSSNALRLKAPRARAVAPKGRAPSRTARLLPRINPTERPTEVLLLRHAADERRGDVLLGRAPGAGLSAEGVDEAHRLARRLARIGVTRVHSSPRQRALETASIIARTLRVPIDIEFDLDDVDYGAWTGLAFADLAADKRWSRWNLLRSLTCPPGGESMQDVCARLMRHLSRAHRAYPGGRIAMVTHDEVIRSAALHCRGLSFDRFSEIEVAPASLLAIAVDGNGPRLAEHGSPE